MKPEEIRAMNVTAAGAWGQIEGNREQLAILAEIQREIAAQLAEIKEVLQNKMVTQTVHGPDLHLWTDEQVKKLKDRGLIVEEEPLTNERIEQEKIKLQETLASPTSDPAKFTRCTWCGSEIPIGKDICDDCIPF